MTEKLLQFIWQFQYYNTAALTTDDGQELKIISQGQFHQNQGPDFQDAKVGIAGTTWAGNIELHLRSSDWHRHHHSTDGNYNNTILHVVWTHDADIAHADGSIIPTLVLQNRVSNLLLDHYSLLQQSPQFVPCLNFLPAVDDLKWSMWKQRLTVERLQRKAADVLQLLQQANNHWEEILWWMLARTFGTKVNSENFEAIARSLPVTLIAKHKNQIHQLEGLLLGQALLLNRSFDEDYPKLLQREYRFLQKKYNLKQVNLPPHLLRMRPANFPTIRLAQLAMLVHQSSHLFSTIIEANSIHDIKQLLNCTANDYWHYHYLLDEPTAFKPKPVGDQMVNNIIINAIVPVVFAFGQFNKNEAHREKAMLWLSQVAAEENTITKQWKAAGVTNSNAAESQALIELKNSYCNERRCLECTIGNAVLKTSKEVTKPLTNITS
jgi:hypothetical protein